MNPRCGKRHDCEQHKCGKPLGDNVTNVQYRHVTETKTSMFKRRKKLDRIESNRIGLAVESPMMGDGRWTEKDRRKQVSC
mmetsp:Transcript_26114/g.61308  ORF Transcript_26114/g.61308 Transcript_26114/m.61308 type:complete len:80 (-) Transcript_26114:17-256(-)